jgi:hypothetical protein
MPYYAGNMVTGFDILSHDKGLRRHWRYRICAFVIDALLTFLPLAAILWLLGIDDIVQVGVITCLAFYISSSIMEAGLGGTAGKLLLGFRLHAEGLKTGRVLVRNLNRLLWFVLPPLDFCLGLATKGDPRQRALDKLAGTKVVHRRDRGFRMPEGLPAAPMGEAGPDEEVSESNGAPETEPATTERCRECGGPLIMLDDQKLQCERCGAMQ